MNKKRFEEFSNYLEGFTQRIVERFPESKDFINNEKTQMLERFPELGGFHQPVKRESAIALIKFTLKSSVSLERRMDYFGVEKEIKRDTPEDCVESINLLARAIGNAHRDVLYYAALQGEILTGLKELCGPTFSIVLRNNINLSRSHAYFLMKFSKLIDDYPKLKQCEVPLNFFKKNFTAIQTICAEDDFWKFLY